MGKDGLTVVLLILLCCCGCRDDRDTFRLGSGPVGGAFRPMAAALAEALNQGLPQIQVRVLSSGGSESNLEGVSAGRFDMGLVYATDLADSKGKGGGVEVLARLYGAMAHLVVRKDSVIASPADLRRRRVAVGGPGSGAARSAERFFSATGVWGEMIPIYIGYEQALTELRKGGVDAVWEMVGVPSPSLEARSVASAIRLVDLGPALEKSAFFREHPSYLPATIPAGSYDRQETAIATFEDSALWVVGRRVDSGLAYRMLDIVFTPPGLDRMRRAHPVTETLGRETGAPRPGFPLHPGAVRFWSE